MVPLKHVDFQTISESTLFSQHSHPASNKIFLLARFAFVDSISLQALQMKVLILLHTLAAQIAS